VLTESIVRAIMPPDELPEVTDRLVFDGGTGFALRVLPNGYKPWSGRAERRRAAWGTSRWASGAAPG
jgi:hypothetical protein